MGRVTYGDAIAIFQLVYYSPALFGSVFISARHGAQKTSGWIFLAIFCIIRLVGAAARMVTITHPTSDNAYTTALICSTLGLSPLLMASLGLISRAYYSILKQPWSTIFSVVIVKIVHTPAIIALILCIVGATSASDPSKIDDESTLHIGVILFAVVLAMLVVLTFGACIAKRKTGQGEGLLVLAVLCALPFLAIRLLYSLLAAFSHSRTFSPITGSTTSETASLFMSVLEEMVVVVVYIATGLKLPAVPQGAADGPGGTMAYRFGRGDFGTGKLGILSAGTALFQAFNRGGRDEQEREGARIQELPRSGQPQAHSHRGR